MTTRRPQIFLIDAYAYIFRAYHALPPLATKTGVPTGATYGFIVALLKILREFKPDYVAVVWDAPGKSFRDEIYGEYKATRNAVPEDLKPQFAQVRRVTEAFRIPHLEAAGYEADDVIATLVKKSLENDVDVKIVSGDKDLYQLVGERVQVVDLVRNRVYDSGGVKEKLGVMPERVGDYLALVGDSSDNIPGVKGVGPKTAVQLLEKYPGIDELLANLATIEPERVRKLVEVSRDNLILSRKLVALQYDAPVAFDRDLLTVKTPDPDKIRPLLVELEFTRLIPEFAPPTEAKKALTHAGYKAVTDDAALAAVMAEMAAAPRFAFQPMTDGADPHRAKIVGAALCADRERAYYVPLAHRYLGAPPQVSETALLAALKPLLEDPAKPKIVHDSKASMLLLGRLGVTLRGELLDPMLAGYVLNPERSSHTLVSLAQDLLDHTMISFEDSAGKGAKGREFHELPVEQAMQFAAEEANVAFLVAPKLEERMAEAPALVTLYREMEAALVPVLADMERAGVSIDVPFLQALSLEYEKTIRDAEKKIYEAAGIEFNIGSPIQLRQVLFERLKLPIQRKTKSGASTDVDVLEKLAEKHPVPNLILAHRAASKLKSTYIDALPRMILPDGRVHTTFNQTVAATGRLSSSDPNLQNIPIRTEEGKKIRRAFVAAPGMKFISADYSQMELRLVAALSGEPEMIEAFRAGEDIHATTAKSVFGSADGDNRSRAKAINFGIIYGQTKYGLANNIDISQADAAKYIDAYFARYPKIREYLDRVLAEATRRGFVETKFGRRRWMVDLNSKNPMAREAARRAAINHPIQGTAADVMKLAMLAAQKRLEAEGLRARMLLQIHDELIFEAPDGEVDRVVALARETMEGVATFDVPLKVDLGTGSNWADV